MSGRKPYRVTYRTRGHAVVYSCAVWADDEHDALRRASNRAKEDGADVSEAKTEVEAA